MPGYSVQPWHGFLNITSVRFGCVGVESSFFFFFVSACMSFLCQESRSTRSRARIISREPDVPGWECSDEKRPGKQELCHPSLISWRNTTAEVWSYIKKQNEKRSGEISELRFCKTRDTWAKYCFLRPKAYHSCFTTVLTKAHCPAAERAYCYLTLSRYPFLFTKW